MQTTLNATPTTPHLGNPIRLFFSATFWRAAVLLFLSGVLGSFWFAVLTMLLSVSIGNSVIWIGIPFFAGTMLLWRMAAQAERRRVAWSLGVSLPAPYRALPESSWWRRMLERFGDPATWRDLGYLLLLFPVGLFELFILCLGLIVPISFIAMPLYYPALHDLNILGGLSISTLPQALVVMGIGLLWISGGTYLIVGMAHLHGLLAQALLGETNAQKTAALTASRERILAATVLERRRIERDLHDGVQQHLVSLALDLGMAKEKMLTQPEEAQVLVGEAHAKAKQAMAELRDVVRGIHPAILTDQGLDAALSALAAASTVPVTVVVEQRGRLPEIVETTAYYLVAEALTNITKHSQATTAAIHVQQVKQHLLIEVSDNGIGGANLVAGAGLAGLAERFAVLGGRIDVSSPYGGPTRITGELPCA